MSIQILHYMQFPGRLKEGRGEGGQPRGQDAVPGMRNAQSYAWPLLALHNGTQPPRKVQISAQ